MKEAIIIGLGGFTGSISRYMLGLAITRAFPSVMPLGTLSINLIGCLLIGFLYGEAEKQVWLNQQYLLFLVVGFCSSFTTFSTFAHDNLALLRSGEYATVITYALISLIAGIILVWVGYIIASKI